MFWLCEVMSALSQVLCPCCEDIFTTRSRLDGAFFTTSLPHLLLLQVFSPQFRLLSCCFIPIARSACFLRKDVVRHVLIFPVVRHVHILQDVARAHSSRCGTCLSFTMLKSSGPCLVSVLCRTFGSLGRRNSMLWMHTHCCWTNELLQHLLPY